MANTKTAESLLAPTATGFATYAVGKGSYAGGYLTTAWKPDSFAHGYDNLAYGDGSAAFGAKSKAMHDRSFVAGTYLISGADHQAVFGTWNEVNSDAALVVGWGQEKTKTRKNVFTVGKDGSGTFAGDIHAASLLVDGGITIGNITIDEEKLEKLLMLLES